MRTWKKFLEDYRHEMPDPKIAPWAISGVNFGSGKLGALHRIESR